MIDCNRILNAVAASNPMLLTGKVTQIIGLVIESDGPNAIIGELCHIYPRNPSLPPLRAEVVGFREKRVLLMPLGEMSGIGPGCDIVASGGTLSVKVGEDLLGRIFDALGNPMDGKPPIQSELYYPLEAPPPPPLSRARITEKVSVGVRAIDGLLTMGRGQRIGIMAGSGVGKSTLLGMIARNTEADINIIALIGERGREVREFIERDLGEDGLKKSVVIVATSDQPALIRIKGALTATAIAEYFRNAGKNVVLMMDSVTRFAMAQREVGLTVGEPPATRGYTPSVFAALPRLLERSGSGVDGAITGIYTVLVEGDDMNEPIADSVRGILDGHIVLSRALGAQNHYPAIDILASVSRVMLEIVNKEHWDAAQELRKVLATYNEAQDLINIGAYVSGSNPNIDHAIKMIEPTLQFLKQAVYEQTDYETCIKRLCELFPAN